MNKRKVADILFGTKCEDNNKKVFEEFFDTKLKKLGKHSIFDYSCYKNDLYIELKSRRNTKDKYPTTMIGYNKFKKALELDELGCVIYFCFQFTDALCYYKFDKENFNADWKARGGRRDRGKFEYKDYIFIPIELLTDI